MNLWSIHGKPYSFAGNVKIVDGRLMEVVHNLPFLGQFLIIVATGKHPPLGQGYSYTPPPPHLLCDMLPPSYFYNYPAFVQASFLLFFLESVSPTNLEATDAFIK